MSEPLSGDALYRRSLPLAEMSAPLLLEGGVCYSKVPLALSPHSHAGFELHCFATGIMDICLPEGLELSARGGQAMLVQPGVVHHGRQDMVLGSQHVWMVIDPMADLAGAQDIADCLRLAQTLRRAGNVIIECNLRNSVLELFRRLKALDRSEPFAAARVRTCCEDMVLTIAASLCDHQAPTTVHDTTIEAIAVMRANLQQALSIDHIAQRVGISTSRFHHRFLDDMGETPAAYYLRIRLQRAAHILGQDPERSVQAVAKDLGFDNGRYFATCFKRFFGQTPTAYRR